MRQFCLIAHIDLAAAVHHVKTEYKEADMLRLFALMVAAIMGLTFSAVAAPQSDRTRGTITAVDANSLTVQTQAGEKVRIALSNRRNM